MNAMTGEIFFYHLETRMLDDVLPGLIERSLERGWRVVVQAGSSERVEALSQHFWTYRDDSFLPHGTLADGHEDGQPVFLTDREDNPNGAQVLFLVDGARRDDLSTFERSVYIFDGRDEQAVAMARSAWKTAQDKGGNVTYWRQNSAGRWEQSG
jgi:DNA polymerase-3 subunit chi